MENPYLNPARVRAALRTLDLRPTRGMGQNFLVDAGALEQIVAAAQLRATDTVIEVGPGLGTLTFELLRWAGWVVAVELDRRLAQRLRQEFAGAQRLTVVQADVLDRAPGDLLAAESDGAGPPYKVVANLPYAITAPVLRHFLAAAQKPSCMVVLVQLEVAERIAAAPGNLSVLAHAVQIYAEPELIGRVPAASFVPIPKVDSAILRLRLRERPAVAVDDPEQLLRFVKAGFLHGRKKLSNALPAGLKAIGEPVEKEQALEALRAAGVDPNRRAETVTLEEWAGVYHALLGQE